MKMRLILTLVGATIILTLASLWMGQQAYSWFPPEASAEAKLIDDLFSFLVALGTFIFLGVTGTLAYSVLFNRVGRYDYSDGPPIEGNVTLEIVWTAIPIALVIWIAGYSYQVYEQMELHLPVDRRIKLALTSDDVLHGFYVPAFRLKQDIIPNKTIDFEFTPTRIGTYRLRDSQYSGTYFAAMQADVVVESPEDYQQWLADAAGRHPSMAYNRASFEYTRAAEQDVVRGWATVTPAPPPLVNYAPKQAPNSPPA